MRAVLLLLPVFILLGDVGTSPVGVWGMSDADPVLRLSVHKTMRTVNKNERERWMAAMLLLAALSGQQHN